MGVGEVILRAPQLMLSYWQNTPATAEALRSRDAGGPWLYTGDLGYLDTDGYLFLVDRKTDLIKTSGYQVWPREIEDVIATHPAVAEVGVAGMPDAVKGEVAKAWVVLRPARRRRQTIFALTVASTWRRTRCRPPSRSVTSYPRPLVGKVMRHKLVRRRRATYTSRDHGAVV